VPADHVTSSGVIPAIVRRAEDSLVPGGRP
jgi:hypothetical protein